MDSPLIDTVLLSAGAIAVLHWFPWVRLTGHRLHRLIAYALGVAVILGAPTLAWLRYAPLAGDAVLRLFWAAGIAAGMATCVTWAVDALIEKTHLSADLEDAADERANRE